MNTAADAGSTHVGVGEFEAQVGAHLERVKAGHVLTLVERGRPVAQLVPVSQRDTARSLEELVRTGRVAWSGRRVAPSIPAPMAPGQKTAADWISEGRR